LELILVIDQDSAFVGRRLEGSREPRLGQRHPQKRNGWFRYEIKPVEDPTCHFRANDRFLATFGVDGVRLAGQDKLRAGFGEQEGRPAGDHLVRYLHPLGAMRGAGDPAAAYACRNSLRQAGTDEGAFGRNTCQGWSLAVAHDAINIVFDEPDIVTPRYVGNGATPFLRHDGQCGIMQRWHQEGERRMLLAAGAFELFRNETIFIETRLNGASPEKAHGTADLGIGQIFEKNAVAGIGEGGDNGDARRLRAIGDHNTVEFRPPVGPRKPLLPGFQPVLREVARIARHILRKIAMNVGIYSGENDMLADIRRGRRVETYFSRGYIGGLGASDAGGRQRVACLFLAQHIGSATNFPRYES